MFRIWELPAFLVSHVLYLRLNKSFMPNVMCKCFQLPTGVCLMRSIVLANNQKWCISLLQFKFNLIPFPFYFLLFIASRSLDDAVRILSESMDALPTVPAVSITVYLYSCLQPCVVLHAVRFLCVPTSYIFCHYVEIWYYYYVQWILVIMKCMGPKNNSHQAERACSNKKILLFQLMCKPASFKTDSR